MSLHLFDHLGLFFAQEIFHGQVHHTWRIGWRVSEHFLQRRHWKFRSLGARASEHSRNCGTSSAEVDIGLWKSQSQNAEDVDGQGPGPQTWHQQFPIIFVFNLAIGFLNNKYKFQSAATKPLSQGDFAACLCSLGCCTGSSADKSARTVSGRGTFESA